MKLKIRAPYLRLAQAACLLLIVGLGWSPPADAVTVGGRAFAAFVNAPTLGAGPLYLSDTGELAPNGGWEGAGLLGAQLPSILSANVLNAATSGGEHDAGPKADSSTSLADVAVLPGQAAQLTASFVRAQAEATGSGTTGSVQIYDLTFGGIPVQVTGLPNQRVEISGLLGPLATLIINEQTVTSAGTSQTITVNALHLILATGEQVILASARSVLNSAGTVTLARATGEDQCVSNQVRKAMWMPGSTGGPAVIPVQGGGPDCIDFVTGGGFFMPRVEDGSPERVNLGFNAGPRSAQNPTLKGHLNVVDHNDGTHVKGLNVDEYFVFDPPETPEADPCRVFGGDAQVNGTTGLRYQALVCDYDEPGRDDRIRIKVCPSADCDVLFGPEFSDVYFADNFDSAKTCDPGESLCGDLDGGNIQLHKSKCPNPAALRGIRENLAKEI